MASEPTAAMLIIGEEILAGRTQDSNLARVAIFLGRLGIEMREARVVPDDMDEIAAAVNALRVRYTYVFTTGGIGPTHDDVTAEAIARAFGVRIDVRADALSRLEAYYQQGDLNDARRRMARIPDGATLIDNPVSAAPGFRIENVFVMAGIPRIVEGMLESLGPQLVGGKPVLTVSLRSDALESEISQPLGRLQAEMPGVRFGSYPFTRAGRFGTRLVARSIDADQLARAEAEMICLLNALNRTYEKESEVA